jgi:hypothetical protein
MTSDIFSILASAKRRVEHQTEVVRLNPDDKVAIRSLRIAREWVAVVQKEISRREVELAGGQV